MFSQFGLLGACWYLFSIKAQMLMAAAALGPSDSASSSALCASEHSLSPPTADGPAAPLQHERGEMNWITVAVVWEIFGGQTGNWGMSRHGLICCSRESKGQDKGKNALGGSSDLCLIGESELNKGATALPPTSPALPCSMFRCLSEASVSREHLRQSHF